MKEIYIKKIRTLGKIGNIVTIVADVLILIMTYIFKYGAMLQQESDETL